MPGWPVPSGMSPQDTIAVGILGGWEILRDGTG
jgi:hypothetical protein